MNEKGKRWVMRILFGRIRAACCCVRQAVARGNSHQGEGMKTAGVERCDDSNEMRGKSCVAAADAFNEITLAQISNSMGFGELVSRLFFWGVLGFYFYIIICIFFFF